MPRTQPPRIQIHDVRPDVEGGRWPVKRTLGDPVVVECDIVRDGHEQLRAVVRHRPPGQTAFVEEPMEQVTPDLWRGSFVTSALGRHTFQVEVWVDVCTRSDRSSGSQRASTPLPSSGVDALRSMLSRRLPWWGAASIIAAASPTS